MVVKTVSRKKNAKKRRLTSLRECDTLKWSDANIQNLIDQREAIKAI